MRKPVIASELFEAISAALGGAMRQWTRPSPLTLQLPPRNILLAEDNLLNQKVAVGLLQRWGQEVTVATNGLEALAWLERDAFDLILMDVQMPEMNGYEATAEIRRREQGTGRRIPIIAMTAEAMKGDREKCLEAGMDDYVPKPIDAQKLYEAISRVPAEPRSPSDSPVAPPGPAAALDPALPAAVVADEGPRGSADVIDWQAAKARVGGTVQDLQEVLALMRQQCPQLLGDISRGIAEGDAALVRRGAHTLKSAAGYFSAAQLVAAARELERIGTGGVMAEAPTALRALETAAAQFMTALQHPPGWVEADTSRRT